MIETEIPVSAGDLFLNSHGRGNVKGALLQIAFDNVASVAAGEVATNVQARACVSGKHRFRGVVVMASAVAGTAKPTADVYVSTASVLGAAVTVTAADTVYAGLAAAPTTVVTDVVYTLRATSEASTGGATNLKAYLLVELISTP